MSSRVPQLQVVQPCEAIQYVEGQQIRGENVRLGSLFKATYVRKLPREQLRRNKRPNHRHVLLAREHEMWDRDVLSANDIIAETSIDLYRWFLKVRVRACDCSEHRNKRDRTLDTVLSVHQQPHVMLFGFPNAAAGAPAATISWHAGVP